MRRCIKCRTVTDSRYAASCQASGIGKGCAGDLVEMSAREIDAYESQMADPMLVSNKYGNPFFTPTFTNGDMADLLRLCNQ